MLAFFLLPLYWSSNDLTVYFSGTMEDPSLDGALDLFEYTQ